MHGVELVGDFSTSPSILELDLHWVDGCFLAAFLFISMWSCPTRTSLYSACVLAVDSLNIERTNILFSFNAADLVSMNETFVRARTIFDRMMEDSLARHTGGEYFSLPLFVPPC